MRTGRCAFQKSYLVEESLDLFGAADIYPATNSILGDRDLNVQEVNVDVIIIIGGLHAGLDLATQSVCPELS